MNKIRNLRHKSPSAVPVDNSMPPGEDHVRGGGLFNKIKRYSNASHKLIRRSNPSHHNVAVPRKHSPHRSTCGSYDMTGDSSRDLRPEIGAPVLITTTALDIDKITPIAENSNLPKSVIPLSSSESDTEVFADASASLNDFGNIKFSFFENGTIPGKSLNLSSSTEEGDYEIVPIIGRSIPHNISLPEERLETICPPMRKNKILSKSVGNLNSPREETTIRHPLSSVDIPVLCEGDDYDSSGYYNEPAADDSQCSDNGQHSNATHNKAARNANTAADKQQQEEEEGEDDGGKLTDFKRSLSAIILHQVRAYEDVAPKEEQRGKSVAFLESEDRISHKSFSSVSCLSDDFDLKSASFEDLKESRQLFLSVEEFNALTKEIHENEEFNNSITMLDQEYCDHRSNLRPNQRRVTLMRNKTNKIHLNLNDKRGKITSVWSGIKHWIDEERGKIKEVVQRHSAMQRVGANLKSPNKGGGGVTAEEAVSPVDKRRSQAEKNGEESTDDLDIAPASAEAAAEAVDCNVAGGVRRDSRRSEERDLFHTLLRQKSKTNSTAASGGGGGGASAAEEGQNGFEELRRYVKQGGDFGKDLAAILQERLEAEHVYSKSLSKMALKLNKTCREIPGSLAEAWRAVATEMESRGEVHRQFSKSLSEEIVKPLKEMVDGQHKTRKTMENTVDKSARLLSEWRQTEAKSKKTSHAAARENEKLQDNALDVRISRSPSISLLPSRAGKSPEKGEPRSGGEKDSKLDVKRRKAEESVKRADVEYYQLCVRAERARVDWEMDVLRSSSVLQALETSRLSHMKGCIASYLKLSQDMCPLLGTAVDRLAPTIANCNVQKDMNVIKNIRRASEGPSEQLLPDFYCEHTTLAMNRERRKQALIKLLQLVRQDLERERRSRNGLRGISQQLNSSADSQSITDKLYHIRSMLTYLEGTRYKIQSTLLELDHKQRGTHPLAPHIQLTRDRNGLQQSILKVPLWLKTGEADGTAGSGPVSANDDEYVNQFIEPATADVRNEAVIGSYTPVYNRSHSQLEMKSPCQFTAQSLSDAAPKNGGVSNRSSTGGGGGKAIDEIDRGIADGGSNQQDSDFDEFSSHDEAEDDDQVGVHKSSSVNVSGEQQKRVVIGRCRAMYSYTPKLYDELELEPGDIIEVHTKEENGWWLGELKNRVGIFPATYVEELHG